MDELKELYGIEMSRDDIKCVARQILTDEILRTCSILEKASNSTQRIDALKRQKAIEFMALLLGETE